MRRCCRPGCKNPAVATLTYVYSDSTAVVGPLATVAEPHSWDLCETHASRITAPKGWDMVRHEGGFSSSTPDDDDLTALADDEFHPVFLRNATAFGFSPRLRADIVLNNLVGHAVLGGVVKVLSDGTPWRPLVHAEDIARAFAVCLEAPVEAIHCRAYNIGTETNNVTVAQIARAVAEVVPGSRVEITGESGADPRSYRVDFSAARRDLGFEANWTVARGAAELYAEYRDRGLTAEDFAHRFVRLARLRALGERGVVDADLRRVEPVTVGG